MNRRLKIDDKVFWSPWAVNVNKVIEPLNNKAQTKVTREYIRALKLKLGGSTLPFLSPDIDNELHLYKLDNDTFR